MTYGLDFGTSNSAVAVLEADGSSRVLPIGWNGGLTVRSVLYFPEGRSRDLFVGEHGIHEYLDRDMRGRFLQSVKSLLREKSFDGTVIRGWGMQRADQLAAHIIEHVRRRANNLTGKMVERVVLGRPVRFSEDPENERLAVERLMSAAALAGFKEVQLQLEPIGAAYHYERTIQSDELVLVADLGGGTTDFTLVRLSPSRRTQEDRSQDMLGNAGVYIGGDKFDSLVMKRRLLKYFGEGSTFSYAGKDDLPIPIHILQQICQWQRIPFLKEPKTRELISYMLVNSSDPQGINRLQSLIEHNLGFELFRAIERAKIDLTTQALSRVVFHHSSIEIEENISRVEFDRIIEPEIQAIDECVNGLISGVGVRLDEIDSVFITGGTSMVPAVRNFLERKFGGQKIRTGDTFTSVAGGLALCALHNR